MYKRYLVKIYYNPIAVYGYRSNISFMDLRISGNYECARSGIRDE